MTLEQQLFCIQAQLEQSSPMALSSNRQQPHRQLIQDFFQSSIVPPASEGAIGGNVGPSAVSGETAGLFDSNQNDATSSSVSYSLTPAAAKIDESSSCDSILDSSRSTINSLSGSFDSTVKQLLQSQRSHPNKNINFSKEVNSIVHSLLCRILFDDFK